MDEETDEVQLDCKLNGCLFFSTTKLARELGKLADEAFSKTGLSPSHAMLVYIINLKGKIKQKDVGELLHLTPSTITRLIDKLELKGYVDKELDGRSVFLLSTLKGQEQQEEIINSWNVLQNCYKGILTDTEMVKFIDTSVKLLDKLPSNIK